MKPASNQKDLGLAQPAVDAAQSVLEAGAIVSESMPQIPASWSSFLDKLWSNLTFVAETLGGIGIYLTMLLIALLIKQPEILLLTL